MHTAFSDYLRLLLSQLTANMMDMWGNGRGDVERGDNTSLERLNKQFSKASAFDRIRWEISKSWTGRKTDAYGNEPKVGVSERSAAIFDCQIF
jgi:hypothetical protein